MTELKPIAAIEQLTMHQQQLDMDGVFVGVSRQALDELLAYVTRADGWQEADAARYRWLRDHSCPPHNFYIAVPDEFHGVRYSPADVDAYIDDARKVLPTPPGGDHA